MRWHWAFNGNGDVRVKSVYDKTQCKQSFDCDLLDIDYNEIQAVIDKRSNDHIRPIAFHVHHSKKFKHPVNTLPIQRKVLDVANMELYKTHLNIGFHIFQDNKHIR